MSNSSNSLSPVNRDVPFLDTLRGILFLVWSQSKAKSFLRFYLLPFIGVFIVSFFLALEPSRESFEGWFIGLYLHTALPLIALSVSGGLLRDEIKDSTMEYLWTRPVSRFRLVLGFYIGAVLKAFLYGSFLATSIWLAGILKGCSPDLGMLPGFLGASFFSALTFSAGGLFLASITGKYMVWGIVYGATIEMGIGRIPTNISRLSIKHYIEGIGQLGTSPSSASLLNSIFVCTLLAGILLAMAVFVFSYKSYSLGHEKES